MFPQATRGSIRCLLWDFGDTLCDERFIWSSGPEWMAIYETFDDGLGRAWCLGEVDTSGFAASLEPQLGIGPAEIEAHMRARCERVEFHPFAFELFRSRRVPQAIVTVNPDLFSEVIVPLWELDAHTDVIVTSWEERSVDKGELCALALERLPEAVEPAEALLIDNRADCIEAWTRRGGVGYHFTTDARLRTDAAGGLDGLRSK